MLNMACAHSGQDRITRFHTRGSGANCCLHGNEMECSSRAERKSMIRFRVSGLGLTARAG